MVRLLLELRMTRNTEEDLQTQEQGNDSPSPEESEACGSLKGKAATALPLSVELLIMTDRQH